MSKEALSPLVLSLVVLGFYFLDMVPVTIITCRIPSHGALEYAPVSSGIDALWI
ncbi:MAG TPA: hypothetical protein VEF34_20860 [Syntrophobacteraceae bacterium]|nr:hypothetical protein [Syntrophobacteraceae bacterium]